MDTSQTQSTGDSPMLTLVIWTFLMALVPGALAVFCAIVKRCPALLWEQETIFRPPESDSCHDADRRGTSTDAFCHEAHDQTYDLPYRPWRR